MNEKIFNIPEPIAIVEAFKVRKYQEQIDKLSNKFFDLNSSLSEIQKEIEEIKKKICDLIEERRRIGQGYCKYKHTKLEGIKTIIRDEVKPYIVYIKAKKNEYGAEIEYQYFCFKCGRFFSLPAEN